MDGRSRKDHPRPAVGGLTPGARELLALVLMWAAVLAVYVPVPELPGDNTLLGVDYYRLHERRIRFAQEALFGSRPHLPAWYPRELLGTPFWSNVQNFPFLPTRLILLTLDPLKAFAVGVNLAALLAATFTYLLCRRLNLGRVASAAAGWTFAAGGFFAARVLVGHLPLLEAYPALPLLLWLVEVVLTPGEPAETQGERLTRLPLPASAGKTGGRGAHGVARLNIDSTHPRLPGKLLALGLACTCVALAGHPQLPLYALVTSGLYLLYRGRRQGRVAVAAGAAMALGVACAAFALWPMYLLIGRSTRLLPLEHAANDIPFPYGRLGAFLKPWKDGWPPDVARGPYVPFAGFSTDAWFWDTVCYVGAVPVAAVLLLGVRALVRRRAPSAPWGFVAAAGVVALLTALPAVQQLISRLPGTIVRSPSRQVYVTTFALAMGLGVAVDLAMNATSGGRRAGLVAGLVAPALSGHFYDLWSHDRSFIRTVEIDRTRGTPLEQRVAAAAAGGGRVAVDHTLPLPFNREYDDVGFFDSIMLARPYVAVFDLAGAVPTLNVQESEGGALGVRALEAAGVRVVVTTRPRPDLPAAGGGTDEVHVYSVQNPLPRAALLPSPSALYLGRAETHRRLRDPAFDLRAHVMLPPAGAGSVTPAPATSTSASSNATVTYARPGSDRIVIEALSEQPGILRVLESWDPGWRATVDGEPATPVPADDVFLGLPLPAGAHRVELEYVTPGARAGAVVSVLSALLLVVLAVFASRWTGARVKPGGGTTG